MLRRLAVLLSVIGLLSGCVAIPLTMSAPSTTVPTLAVSATSTDTPSPTLTPSVTPIPSETPNPTATPFPPLSGTGPFLMIRRHDDTLMLYNNDGRGRRALGLPDGCRIHSYVLSRAVSPDGKWLTCYSGLFPGSDSSGSLPISLYMVSIADGTSRKVADVAMEDYQDKLQQVADELKKQFPTYYATGEDGKDWAFRSVLMDFEWNIFANAWSPDSRQLAFAAQIEGNSSDVYVYELETRALRRVEDSLRNVASIDWSPKGQYILFDNSLPGQTYTPSDMYAVKSNAELVKEPTSLTHQWFAGRRTWLSETLLLTSDGTDTAGPENLYTLDVATGKRTDFWKGTFGGFDVDFPSKTVVMTTSEFTEPQEDWGLYFFTFGGKKKKITDGYFAGVIYRGNKENYFIGLLWDNYGPGLAGSIGITSDGNVHPIDIHPGHTYVSPDLAWVLVYDETTLYLYNKEDRLIKSFDMVVSDVSWRPDSQGFFFSSAGDIYYFPISADAPVLLISQEAPNEFSVDSVWIP